jgi:hypothetical protein
MEPDARSAKRQVADGSRDRSSDVCGRTKTYCMYENRKYPCLRGGEDFKRCLRGPSTSYSVGPAAFHGRLSPNRRIISVAGAVEYFVNQSLGTNVFQLHAERRCRCKGKNQWSTPPRRPLHLNTVINQGHQASRNDNAGG